MSYLSTISFCVFLRFLVCTYWIKFFEYVCMGRFQHSIHNITYLKEQIEVQKLIDGLSLHNIVIKYDTWMISSQKAKPINRSSVLSYQIFNSVQEIIKWYKRTFSFHMSVSAKRRNNYNCFLTWKCTFNLKLLVSCSTYYIIQLPMLCTVINWRWQKFLRNMFYRLKSFVTFFKFLTCLLISRQF